MEEPWTILELAELAADALAATQPTGPLADAGMPSAQTGLSAVAGRPAETGSSAVTGPCAGTGSSAVAGQSAETWSSAVAGQPDETAGSAGARLGAEAGLPAETATSAGVRAPSGRVRANGRVRDVPNERLVRWYVTVGLVDPPLSRRGRVARYGRRHLLQLVAVKRRQAEGRSLAEIQAELAGATDEALAAVARVPDTAPALQPVPAVLPAAPTRFWTRSATQRDPAVAEEPGERDPAPEEPGERDPAAEEPGERDPAAEEPGERDPAAAAGA